MLTLVSLIAPAHIRSACRPLAFCLHFALMSLRESTAENTWVQLWYLCHYFLRSNNTVGKLFPSYLTGSVQPADYTKLRLILPQFLHTGFCLLIKWNLNSLPCHTLIPAFLISLLPRSFQLQPDRLTHPCPTTCSSYLVCAFTWAVFPTSILCWMFD